MIRGVVKALGEEELQPLEVLSYVNLAQQMVYNEAPKELYTKSETVSESSDTIDFSTLEVDTPIKLVDSVNGTVDRKGLLEFEELADDPSKRKRVYATQIGESFSLFKGDEASAYGTFTFTFVRKITPCSAETDYLDIEDKYINKVFTIAKELVKEQLGTK